MFVYGFYGPSGTGKSYLALSLCNRLKVDYFIDDGLFIYKGKKIAGISAKYEENRITAVKRAIFEFEDHRQEVIRKIREANPEKLLIIGTSIKMVKRIADRLQLPEPSEWLKIEEVSDSDSIQKAMFVRKMQGQHVIPIHRVQVEKDRFHRLIDRVKSIFDVNSKFLGENTVVHPLFHGGRIKIRQVCLKKIVLHNLLQNEYVCSVSSIHIPIDLYDRIHIAVTLYDSQPIIATCEQIQVDVMTIFQKMLNISIPPVSIYVKNLEMRRKEVETNRESHHT